MNRGAARFVQDGMRQFLLSLLIGAWTLGCGGEEPSCDDCTTCIAACSSDLASCTVRALDFCPECDACGWDDDEGVWCPPEAREACTSCALDDNAVCSGAFTECMDTCDETSECAACR